LRGGGTSGGLTLSRRLRKKILNNGDFVFPLGDNGRYGPITIYNTTNAAAAFWEADYFNTGHSSSSVTGSLVAVSTDEYWRIDNPAAGNAAEVKLRWDPNSDITPITTGDINDIVVAEYNGVNWVDKASDAPTGNNYNGTVKTTSTINTDPIYYTLGSTATILAQAYFTTLDDVCDGLSIPVSFSGVVAGDLDFTLSYSKDGVDQADVNVTSLTYSLPTSGAGDYRLNGFTFNGGTPGGFNTSIVTVNPSPAQPTITPADGDPSLTFCEGGSVILTSSAAPVGGSYLWSNTETNQNANVNTTGNYTVQVTNSFGCYSPASAVKVVTVNPLPLFTPSALPGTICFGSTSQLHANFVGVTYLWSPADDLDNPGIENPVFDPSITGTNPTSPIQRTTLFSVTVTDSNGCEDTGTVSVIVNRRPETGPQYHISNTWP